MTDDGSLDYKALFHAAEEGRRRAEELRGEAEDQARQERARNQPTTLWEFMNACHDLLSRPLKVGSLSHSTKGNIPPPTGKYCPTKLCLWSDCPTQQQEIYNVVSTYLQLAVGEAPRLFASLVELHGISRRFSRRQLRSERDLEIYERVAVEDHVHDIIAELCKIPEAQKRFQLGEGVMFDSHTNALEDPDDDAEPMDESSTLNPRPDQFCIHRVDSTTRALLTTVEYKPPHKLSVENLRVGLRPMEFWEEVVQATIPPDTNEKLKYNAEQLTGAVLAQEYHVMIQQGLEYSYITNGFALILLHVPYDDPSTLYYHLFEPNMDVNPDDPDAFLQPKTAIARVLCLCLMSFSSQIRSQTWRNAARSQLHLWETSFDYIHSTIPNEELKQVPPGSEYASSEETASEYLPSSPLQSPPQQGRRVSTRSRAGCSPMDTAVLREPMESSDSDSGPATQSRKRSFGQIMSSPSNRSSDHPADNNSPSSGEYRQHTEKFCTQQCLLGLQQKEGLLDRRCPNVHLHQQGQNGDRHRIDAGKLVQLLKQQLDHDLDHNCTPFGECGSYGAPFKITCATYGYTVVGKGTTSRLWKLVSREADIYRILQKAQGSAVPVFLGTINLELVYFLHGAGEIRHMLLMGWGGGDLRNANGSSALYREISRSKKEIRMLGVVHDDLRNANMLWNDELGRVLIIDFHRSHIDCRPKEKRIRSLKGSLDWGRSKRQRLSPCK
ncbi:hypothetical protein I7I53_11001 [Histoplasma capsulatum var. duboisii H88]|uniref:Protein kinase domain-containing protein n=1 Tax=Ajellomyces capsulatus (strain H88) TaxID=544711 RepID=A0A8A1L8Q2_AJEC8|nr:hypothetical protein I7I53_11001 [Histoplasma capsulatum var. duboisii H88]